MAAQRNEKGQYVKGHENESPGRPKGGRSITQALRDIVDPDEYAAILQKRARKEFPALVYLIDRMEGRPQATIVQAMTPEQQDAFRELAQALRGNGDKP